MTDVQVAQRLIADGAMPRFANLSLEAQRQVADVLVLAEQDPKIAALMRGGDDGTLTGVLATHGIQLNDEALGALAQPPELDDPQLEQVEGGSATLAIIGAFVVPIATLWITTHYSAKVKIAETTPERLNQCQDPDLNWGHGDFQSPALPTELSRPVTGGCQELPPATTSS